MIVIIGAGPTGLGAAYRLHELGITDFVVLERASGPGGLATSYVDDKGFTWDVGGHVQFSHYRYYDDVLDRAVACGWLEHDRSAWVWTGGRWIPYPFQYNVHRLTPADAARALHELEALAPDRRTPSNFREWIEWGFGRTIAESFMVPYNLKVWGYPLETLGVEWMGERVAPVDLDRLRRNVASGAADASWGPNSRFRFPRAGGTGAIWKGVAALLPPSCLRWNSEVESLDAANRCVRLRSGESFAYDDLVTTMPLDALCARADGLPAEVMSAAGSLVHSSIHVIGIGLRWHQPEALRQLGWMYFPENHSPYYRVTVFTNYSPDNAPPGDGYWSLMAEVCESPVKPVDAASLPRRTIEALRRDGLIDARSDVVSLWHRREEHGYPTPFLGRDAVLASILPRLEERRVYSRGRFGAWKYEVSNQDHSFMQGVEVVDRLLGLGDEPTLHRPREVNGGAFSGKPSRRSSLPHARS